MLLKIEHLQLLITIIQLVGVPLFFWIAIKVKQIHRYNKLTNIKAEALVDTLSNQFGNGEFRDKYDKNVEKKKDDYNFVYKEK